MRVVKTNVVGGALALEISEEEITTFLGSPEGAYMVLDPLGNVLRESGLENLSDYAGGSRGLANFIIESLVELGVAEHIGNGTGIIWVNDVEL